MSQTEQNSIIVTQGRIIKFAISFFAFKPQSFKCDWCRKSRQRFAFFDPLWNLGESGRNIWVNFTSSAYDIGLSLMGRLSIDWEIRVLVSNTEEHTKPSDYRRCGLKSA